MKVNDIILNNAGDTSVILQGNNPIDDCDPFCEVYFEGLLKDIPENFFDCDVLFTGWKMVAQKYCIAIPYLKG